MEKVVNNIIDSYPMHCNLCPRNCGAERIKKEKGFCVCDDNMNIASVCVHQGEEPPISGTNGILNIFFSGCNMRCIFCQNYQISRSGSSADNSYNNIELLLSEIQNARQRGCRNVGFVSPSHLIPSVSKIISFVKRIWNDCIFVYNTNGYDKVDVLKTLEEDIAVYLPDFKYSDEKLAESFSAAPDYPRIALKAIKEMVRQKGTVLKFSSDGIAERGVLIRHLILPGCVENSKKCLRMLADEISNELYISLMSQYYPVSGVVSHPVLGRNIMREEYDEVLEEMDKLGFRNGWIQAPESRDSYKPDFNKENPFGL